MKKFLLAVAILVLVSLAVILGLSYRSGVKAEETLRARVAEWDLPGVFDVSMVEYDRGLFRSHAVTRVVFEPTANVAEAEIGSLARIQVQHTVYHGPFPFAGAFYGEEAPSAAAAVVDSTVFFEKEPEFYKVLFDSKPFLEYRAVIDFHDRLDGTIVGPELRYEPSDADVRVVWSGIRGRMTAEGTKLTLDLKGPGLSVKGSELAFALGPFSVAARGENHPSGMAFIGTRNVKLESIRMSDKAGNTLFGAEGIAASQDQTEKDGALDSHLVYGVGKVAAEGDRFGPFECVVDLRRMDIEGIGALQDFFQEFSRTYLTEEMRGSVIEEKWVPAMSAILARSPEFDMSKFRLVTPEGELNARMKVTGHSAGPVTAGYIYNIERYLEADADLVVPRTLLRNLLSGWFSDTAAFELMLSNPSGNPKQKEVEETARKMAEDLVQTLVAERWLVARGADLTAHLELADGELKLNGKKIDLPDPDM
jgi:uncharacterized protein YdgA (DUF945 family)